MLVVDSKFGLGGGWGGWAMGAGLLTYFVGLCKEAAPVIRKNMEKGEELEQTDSSRQ